MTGTGSGRRRPGPIYDDAMRILADDDLAAVLSILGISGPAERMDTALPGSSRSADLLVRTPEGIVHVEYVKDPTPDLDLRMVDYRLRIRRRDRTTSLAQHALVLSAAEVPDRHVDRDGSSAVPDR